MKDYDCVVIGGGPAGITACMYLLRAGVSVAWIERLSPGGQVLNTEVIENYPGFPEGIKGYELVSLMEKHLEPFEFDRIMDEVKTIEIAPGKHKLVMSQQEVWARSVIVCSGARHRHLSVPGEEELTGKGVSYCALCDGMFFKDQVVACVGGGNTALEESLYLSRLAQKVYLIHRRDEFRGYKIYQQRVLEEQTIEVVFDTVVEEIKGKDKVEGLVLRNVRSGEKSFLKVDGVFIFVGIVPQGEFLPPEIEKDERGFVITDGEMRTSVEGIFAAGDIRSKRCRQVITATGDGAAAAHSAYLYLQELSN